MGPFLDEEPRPPTPLRALLSGARQLPLTGAVLRVRIAPSFHDHADLGVVTATCGDEIVLHRVGIVIGGHPDGSARADMTDLVLPSLSLPPLLPIVDEGSMMDGCSYVVDFMGMASSVRVRFAPVSERWEAWARAFMALARRLHEETGNATLGEYLQMWSGYLE